MIKRNLVLTFFLATIIFLSSCNKDDEETLLPIEERIVGTWVIQNSIVFGIEIPGDGSTLTFNECGTTCTGVDFLASDETSGTFTYSFTNNDSVLSIEDNDAEAGGAYTGDWEITTFTNSTISFGADSFLGPVSFTFSKQ